MKNLLLIALILSGCGSDSSKTPDPTPIPAVATPSPSPTPTPIAQDAALVGNWIDASKNTLVFKDDNTATSNKQNLTWSIDADKKIILMADLINVDTCAYSLISSGGLSAPLIIILDLICQKAGTLSFSRAP